MSGAQRNWRRRAVGGRPVLWGFVAVCCVSLALPCATAADPAPRVERNPTYFIKIPLPITTDVKKQVLREIARADEKLPRRDRPPYPTLLVELSSGQVKDGAGSEFSDAHGIARALADAKNMRTLAYVPKSICGHAVLVALACDEIVLAPDATIGDAGHDEKHLTQDVRIVYDQISRRRKPLPPELALGMVDAETQVLRVVSNDREGTSAKFIDAKNLAEFKKTNTLIGEPEPLKRPVVLSAFELSPEKFGLLQRMAKDRGALARAINADPGALVDRPMGELIPIKVVINTRIGHSLVEGIKTAVNSEIERGANFLVVQIDTCPGTNKIVDMTDLANFFADLSTRDNERVWTVAYLPSGRVTGNAPLLALACDQIVMVPGAVLGGLGESYSAEDTRTLVNAYKEIAKNKQREWSLGAALLDSNIRVYKYAHDDTIYYLSPEEMKVLANGDEWKAGDEITRPQAGVLKLDAKLAGELDVATVVERPDQFLQRFGLTKEPPLVRDGWAMKLVRALARPELAVILLIIGFAGIYVELHAPGTGIGAFVAFLCFLIYFWAHYLNGTAGMLQVLLFLAGVICLLLEIFVIPGFGIFGIGGGLLILASIVLASQTFIIPRNEYQMDQFLNTMLMLFGATIGMVVVATTLRRYLPQMPVFNRMLLEPPSEHEAAQLASRESLVNYEHLLGLGGAAITKLTPAGKAQFQDELVNVVTEGDFIERGDSVVVVEVRGNRIVVRRAEA